MLHFVIFRTRTVLNAVIRASLGLNATPLKWNADCHTCVADATGIDHWNTQNYSSAPVVVKTLFTYRHEVVSHRVRSRRKYGDASPRTWIVVILLSK